MSTKFEPFEDDDWVEDDNFDDDLGYETGYYPCSCPYCYCDIEVWGGGVCPYCEDGEHQS